MVEMAWSGHESQERYNEGPAEFLRGQPTLVSRFGEPEYDDDGDRYWKWWEFAVYDGVEWQSVHQSGSYGDELVSRRERAAKAALEQFQHAA